VSKLARLLSVLALFPALRLGVAQEEVYLKVTTPGVQRVVIAIGELPLLAGGDPLVASRFLEALRSDLRQSAVMSLLSEEAARLVEVDPKNALLTRQRYRSVGAHFLLEGNLIASAGQLVAEVRLFDLASGEVAYSRRLQAAAPLAATMAHTLANELVRLLTGRTGPFLSRFAFISDRTGHKEVFLMRWDGSEVQQLTNHKSVALAPAWSPAGDWLVFTSFLSGRPQLYSLRPTEGFLKPISSLPGVNSSATLSPDGTRVAFAAGDGGNTDIYVVPVTGGTPERLTSSSAIETQPAWAPNGRQIVFTSSAAGSPQLYIMDVEGTNIRRLTFADTFADEAAWAPDGVRLAYTTLVEGRFQIAILDLRTMTRTVVAGPGNNESPCWSPDGSTLAFVSDRTGRHQIYVTDPEGIPRQLTSEGSNTSPAWVASVR
jgi:TolB protein